MKQTLELKDNYSLQFISDNWEKNVQVCLVDNESNTITVLAKWEEGKWVSSTPYGLNQFFELAELYPSVKRKVRESLASMRTINDQIKSANKMIRFAHRYLNISVYKLSKYGY